MKRFFLFIFLLSFGFSFSTDYSHKRGEYGIGYTDMDTDLARWLSGFDILELGGIYDSVSDDLYNLLKGGGVRYIIFYDWMPATYFFLDGNNNEFDNYVYQNRYDVTLNPDGPYPHAEENGYTWLHDYYFDFGKSQLIDERIQFQLKFMSDNGFDGIFFDWASGTFINEDEYSEIKDNFESRNYPFSYLQSVGFYYFNLRNSLPEDKILVTNQGFRNPQNVIPYTTYDLTESYITTDVDSGEVLNVRGYGRVNIPLTDYYPVSGDKDRGSIDDTFYYVKMVSDTGKEYGGKYFRGVIYLSYAAPIFEKVAGEGDLYEAKTPLNAIVYNYAFSKLFNEIGFTEVDFDTKLEMSDVYFVNLGEPESSILHNTLKKYYLRFFKKGFVIVGEPLSDDFEINIFSEYLPERRRVYDFYSKKWLSTGKNCISFEIKPVADTLRGSLAPYGRVFLYEEPEIKNAILLKNFLCGNYGDGEYVEDLDYYFDGKINILDLYELMFDLTY